MGKPADVFDHRGSVTYSDPDIRLVRPPALNVPALPVEVINFSRSR